MTQEAILNILKTGVNVFLTGEPGSGKTHVVREYVEYLRDRGVVVAVTASTGIAATHLGGITIHSWSGIGIKKQLTKSDLTRLRDNSRLKSRAEKTSVLIIDEISMLDAATLNTVDLAVRSLKNNSKPFGGIQLVLVGNFFQLPPVVQNGEVASFAFESNAWDEANLTVCYLSEQHRQEDEHFLNLLGQIRQGLGQGQPRGVLVNRVIKVEVTNQITRLYSHNVNVDHENNLRLKSLSGEKRQFVMHGKGPLKLVEQLKKNCLSPELLTLKVGAKVMFTKNNFEAGYVNGTLGEVSGFGEQDLPIIVTRAGRRIKVALDEWVVEDRGKVIAQIEQLPLRLAWAITVHKSQGMSLDAAIVDLSSAFEYGQGYVALSRVRSLAGLHLLGLNLKALEVHPKILSADKELRTESNKVENKFVRLNPDELHQLQQDWLHSIGGKKGKAQKVDTYKETHKLFVQGFGIEEISQARGLVSGTIIGHLEKLRERKQLDRKELKRVVPPELMPKASEIKKIFKKLRTEKLAPVMQMLNYKYSYAELRLVRLTM